MKGIVESVGVMRKSGEAVRTEFCEPVGRLVNVVAFWHCSMDQVHEVVNVSGYAAANRKEPYRPRNVCCRPVTAHARVYTGNIMGNRVVLTSHHQDDVLT
jgi:hypothetical protein